MSPGNKDNPFDFGDDSNEEGKTQDQLAEQDDNTDETVIENLSKGPDTVGLGDSADASDDDPFDLEDDNNSSGNTSDNTPFGAPAESGALHRGWRWLTTTQAGKATMFGISGVLGLLLFLFLGGGGDLLPTGLVGSSGCKKVKAQLQDACQQKRITDNKDCSQKISKLEFKTDPSDSKKCVADGFDPVDPKEIDINWLIENAPALTIKLDPINNFTKYTMGIEDLAACPGGGNSSQDIEFQNMMYARNVLPTKKKINPLGLPSQYGFTVLESPKGGNVQCCQAGKGRRDTGDCVIPSDPANASNCVVSRNEDYAMYCGTIREDAYVIPDNTSTRIRPEDIAVSFMYYRSGAVAMSNIDIAPDSVWSNTCNVPGTRIFDWANINEILTSKSLDGFSQSKQPSYLKENKNKTSARAAANLLLKEHPAKDRNVCFIMIAAGDANVEPDKDAVPKALSMPIFASYDAFETPDNIRVAQFLKRLYKQSNNPQKWANIVFKGAGAQDAERQRKLFLEAMKNPVNGNDLSPPLEQMQKGIEILKKQKAFRAHAFTDTSSSVKDWEIEIMEQGLFEGVTVKYDEVIDQGSFEQKYNSCEKKGKCCSFISDYPFLGPTDAGILEEYDPSVVALFANQSASTLEKQCISHLFYLLLNDEVGRASIISTIQSKLGQVANGECASCRPGGLLPSHLVPENTQDPGNHFNSSAASCANQKISIRFPSGKHKTLEQVAQNIKTYFTNKKLPMKLDVAPIDLGGTESFDILLDSQLFYSLKETPTLYRLTLPDQNRGRGPKILDDCMQCLAIKMDEIIFDGTPPYAENACSNDPQYQDDMGYGTNLFLTKKCKINENLLYNPSNYIPLLEKGFQKSAAPMLHLLYYVPYIITTEVPIKGGTCRDVTSKVISGRKNQ